jgi:hypothetical protein
MGSSILLKEKWRVQKELAEKADYDLAKYAELVDNIVKEVFEKYNKKHNLKKNVSHQNK